MGALECFRCGQAGHFSGECSTPRTQAHPTPGPALTGARGTHDEHMKIIGDYVAAWHEGQISTGEKRRAISDEDQRYYGDACRPALIWKGGPGDDTYVVQDAWDGPGWRDAPEPEPYQAPEQQHMIHEPTELEGASVAQLATALQDLRAHAPAPRDRSDEERAALRDMAARQAAESRRQRGAL